MLQVLAGLGMTLRLEDLDVVERCGGLVDLEGKIVALAIQNGMLRKGKVFAVYVGRELVVHELHCHRVPTIGVEIERAFTVAIAEIWHRFIRRRLNVEMIGPNMNHRVVPATAAGNEPNVTGFPELKIEANHRVAEPGILQKDSPRIV